MNTQKRNLSIVLVVIVVIAVFGVWYSVGLPSDTLDQPIATSTPSITATSSMGVSLGPVTWKTYRDQAYVIGYKSDAIIGTVAGTISTLARGTIATQFEFPASYYKESTFVGAAVTVVVTNTACSKSVDGVYSFVPAKTVVKNGVPFTVTHISDAGAGHFYYTIEYATMKGDLCYRISLNEHLLNPSPVYGDDKIKIDAAVATNAATRTKLAAILDEMVGTFAFTR